MPGLFFFNPVLNNFVFFCQFLLSLLCSPYGQVFSFSKSLSGTFVIARCKTKVLKKVPASFHCAVTSCAGRERLSLLFSQEGKLTTLIETRGNGGLILCAPGDGYELIQGDYTQLSVLTVEEREILLNAAWHFDEKPITGSSTEPISLNSTNENDFSDCSSGSFALRPGDDYDARGDVREILIKHGWTSLSFRGDREDWKRPGKEGNGISATLQNEIGRASCRERV